MTPEDLNLNFIAKLWFENLCHMEVRASVAGSNWQTWLINNMLMCQICLGNNTCLVFRLGDSIFSGIFQLGEECSYL